MAVMECVSKLDQLNPGDYVAVEFWPRQASARFPRSGETCMRAVFFLGAKDPYYYTFMDDEPFTVDLTEIVGVNVISPFREDSDV